MRPEFEHGVVLAVIDLKSYPPHVLSVIDVPGSVVGPPTAVALAPDESFAIVLDQLARLAHQDLLDFGRLAELLGYDRKLNTLDYPVSPRGFRILGRIPRLPRLVVQRIVTEFGGLEELLAASDGELETVDGVGEIRAKDIREGLRRQQEINLVDRYLQT